MLWGTVLLSAKTRFHRNQIPRTMSVSFGMHMGLYGTLNTNAQPWTRKKTGSPIPLETDFEIDGSMKAKSKERLGKQLASKS